MFPLLPFLSLWSAITWASSPLELLRESLAQPDGAPSMAIACGEIGELQSGLQESATGNLAVVAMESRLPYSSSGQQAREWIRLIRAGGLEGLGLDVDRSVLVELWLDDVEGYRASVPMGGSIDQVQELMERIFRDHLVQNDEGWMVRPWDPNVEGPWVAELMTTDDGQNLVFVKGNLDSQSSPPVSMLDNIPDANGCYFAIRLNQEDPIQLRSAMVALSSNPTQPVMVRVQTDIEMPRPYEEGYGLPIGGSSTETPFMVIGLGISPFDLAETPMIQDTLGNDIAAQIDTIRDYIQLPAGTTVALYGDFQSPEFLVVLPIQSARGRTISPRRLNRVIRRALPEDMLYERIAKDAFTAQFDDRTFHARINAGHIILGFTSERVNEVAEGVGEPWLTAEDLAWVEERPITMKFHTPNQVPFMSDGLGGLVGLRARDGRIELSMLPSTPLRSTLPSILAMGAGMAIPNFITMQHRAKREELTAHVASIHSAMMELSTSALTEEMTACTIENPTEAAIENGVPQPLMDCGDEPLLCIEPEQIVNLLLPNRDQQEALSSNEPFLWVQSPWGTEPLRLQGGDEIGSCGGLVTEFEVQPSAPDATNPYTGRFTIQEEFTASNGAVVRTSTQPDRSRLFHVDDGVRSRRDAPVVLQTLSLGETPENIILPVAPRPIAELDPDPVDWQADASWALLPWAPEYSVRGAYWVERRDDGSFEVHGQADIDGDGIPCHVVQGQDESEPVMLTDPNLY